MAEEASSSDPTATQPAVDHAVANNVDLTQVTGTGVDGKITKPDVEAHIASQSPPAGAETPPDVSSAPTTDTPGETPIETVTGPESPTQVPSDPPAPTGDPAPTADEAYGNTEPSPAAGLRLFAYCPKASGGCGYFQPVADAGPSAPAVCPSCGHAIIILNEVDAATHGLVTDPSPTGEATT